MLLFAFSLILAGGAVALTAFLGISSSFLQQMLMYSVAGVLGVAGFIGLILILIEKGQTKKREARLKVLREGPSGLVLAPPAPEPAPPLAQMEAAPTMVADPPAHMPTPEPKPEPTPEPAVVEAPAAPPVEEPPVEAAPAVAIGDQPQAALPTIDDEQSTAIAEEVAPVAEEVPAPELPAREPADQRLHLDPEYELSEVKRVLRIWQMTYSDERTYGEIASWSGADGTQIDLVDDEGTPFLEIRGPMAEELAEFLPQDLPVHVTPFDTGN